MDIQFLTPPTPALRHAQARLEEALAAVFDAPPARTFYLADVSKPLPPHAPLPADHRLSGPQAHRILITPDHVLLLGHGDLGVAYAVERFRAQALLVDPLAWWTGIPVARHNPALHPADILVPPPVFEHRIYYENDADELINHSSRRLQLEWPEWKALIDTILALGYSGLEPFDSLGRSEFLRWDHYTAQARYEVDQDLIGRVLTYAHEKGLLLEVQMSLAWPFRRLPAEKGCWSRHAEEWKAIWRYYLQETPIRHADICAVSIGDPLWDGEYRCRCELCAPRGPKEIRREYTAALVETVRTCAPDKVMTFGTYGLTGKLVEISPTDPVVVEFSDRGFGEFADLPDIPAAMPKGAYIHAGYWLDHTIQNPYVARVGDSLRMLAERHATRWLRVNGQSVKPFLLMIHACAVAAWNPAAFDADAFMRQWAQRRLHDAAAAELFVQFQHAMLAAHESVRIDKKDRGYVQLLLGHVLPLFRTLAGDTATLPTFNLVFYRDNDSIWRCFGDAGSSPAHAAQVRRATQSALQIAEALHARVGDPALRAFIDDQCRFPARLFDAAAAIYELQADMLRRQQAGEDAAALADDLVARTRAMYDLCLTGPDHPKWNSWYLPARQRVFGTPPPPALAAAVKYHLESRRAPAAT